MLVGRKLQVADVDLDGIVQEIARQGLHLTRPGGRPEERLPIGADLADDLADLRLKTHIQHAVRLVQHQVGHPAQVGGASLKEINEAARRRNADFHAGAQVARLRALGHAAVDAGVLDARGVAELVGLSVGLHGQLARRR